MTQADAVAIDRLREAIARVLPVVSTETPDYAELTFGDARAQAMTMEPDTFLALNSLPDLITAYESQADTIEGLTSDLQMAVQVAWRRGAKDWARLNYPGWVEWLRSCDEADRDREQQHHADLRAALQSPPATENGE